MENNKVLTREEIDEMIEELREYESIAKEASARVESIKDELKAYLGDTETYYATSAILHYTTVKSTRFDASSFRKFDPDTYDKFLKESSYRRFSIN